MKIVIEPHCHTVQSKHSGATLTGNIAAAKKKGLLGLCVTNHGPAYGDSPSEAYFAGLSRLPSKDGDFLIYKGAEVNILDDKGTVDLSRENLYTLDWVIASIHSVCFKNYQRDYITRAYINALKNPFIHCLGHIGQSKFPCDLKEIIKTAKEYNKIIEINNSSLTGMREGASVLCREVIRLCKEYEVLIAITSDAHESKDIGNFTEALKLAEEINFPEELIVNSSINKFNNYIKR